MYTDKFYVADGEDMKTSRNVTSSYAMECVEIRQPVDMIRFLFSRRALCLLDYFWSATERVMP